MNVLSNYCVIAAPYAPNLASEQSNKSDGTFSFLRDLASFLPSKTFFSKYIFFTYSALTAKRPPGAWKPVLVSLENSFTRNKTNFGAIRIWILMPFPSQHSEDLAIPHCPDSEEHHFPLHVPLLSSLYQRLPKISSPYIVLNFVFLFSWFCPTTTWYKRTIFPSFPSHINPISSALSMLALLSHLPISHIANAWCSSTNLWMDKSLLTYYGKELLPHN